MVMLVWWILSLFGICSFGWLPVMIDAILTTIGTIIIPAERGEEVSPNDVVGLISLSVAIYAFCSQFLSLSLPFWCVFISPIWFLVAVFFPGGFTITNFILNAVGVMSVPVWVFVVGGIADLLIIALIIYAIVISVRSN